MSREMTESEAIANLNHIYGFLSPNIQRSLDVAFKAMDRQQGEWKETELLIDEDKCKEFRYVKGYYHKGCPNMGKYLRTTYSFCPYCGADMRKPNCVTCDHFGKCEGCEKGGEE